jgi:hypothetical protein
VNTLGSSLRMVILLPHRDCRRVLRDYRRRLFAAGLWGAYSFPEAVPLALVSRPFTETELKALAGSLRDLSLGRTGEAMTAGGAKGGRTDRDGKMTAQGPAMAVSLGGTSPEASQGDASPDQAFDGPTLFGPALALSGEDWSFPASSAEALRFRFPTLVLAAALVGSGARARQILAAVPLPDPISFRAAAVANLLFKPLPSGGGETADGYSFCWEIGKPRWLPAPERSI